VWWEPRYGADPSFGYRIDWSISADGDRGWRTKQGYNCSKEDERGGTRPGHGWRGNGRSDARYDGSSVKVLQLRRLFSPLAPDFEAHYVASDDRCTVFKSTFARIHGKT
jgi:hypothetical protein